MSTSSLAGLAASLATPLSGLNIDLEMIEEPDSEGEGNGEGSDDDSDEDSQDGSGGGDDDSDDDPEGSGEGSGDDDEPGDNGDDDPKDGDCKNPAPKGGSEGSDESQKGIDEKALAEALIREALAGVDPGLVDNNTALGTVIDAENDEDTKPGETAWRPFNPAGDIIRYAHMGDSGQALRMVKSVRKEVSFLKARMRTKFLLSRQRKDIHGIRRGQGLSDRRLVQSVVELRSGVRASRPDWRREKKEATTIAIAVILDESGSMDKLRVQTAKAGLLLAETMDSLGSPCLVAGVQNSSGHTPVKPGEVGNGKFHRFAPIRINVYKGWEEKMAQCRGRFPNLKASGGTPLSDGIQYGLQELSERTERYRAVLVVTDGRPAQVGVVRHQIRKGAEAGIPVIGIGIGRLCAQVRSVFGEHVVVPHLANLPVSLFGVLNQVVFPARAKKVSRAG